MKHFFYIFAFMYLLYMYILEQRQKARLKMHLSFQTLVQIQYTPLPPTNTQFCSQYSVFTLKYGVIFFNSDFAFLHVCAGIQPRHRECHGLQIVIFIVMSIQSLYNRYIIINNINKYLLFLSIGF